MNEHIDDKNSKAVLDRITIICTLLTILISAIILAGWLFNFFDLTRSNPIYKPTSPGSALSLIVSGCALLVYFYLPVNHPARKLAKVGVCLVLAFDLIILVEFITGRGFDIERSFFPLPETVNDIIGRMSPISGISFVISGFAVLLLLFSPGGKQRTKSMAANLASVSLYIGIIVFIGYLYGTPFFGGTIIPTSFSTSIIIIIFSTGIITAAGMEYLPLRLFIGDSVRAKLMRSFIPVMIAYIVLEGILEVVFFPYSNENVLESSIIMIFFFIFGVIVTSRIAQTVGGDVDRKNLIQRERAACALRESESKFRAIFETVPEGLGLIRLKDDLLIEANTGILQMFGYAKDELIGKNIREQNIWFDPDDKNEMLEQLHSSNFAHSMEVKYRKKNGEISIGTYSAAKLLINNEPHLIISTRDISQRKRVEEMLRQSEEKYRVLIENIQDGIFIIQNAKMKFVNEGFARITGYSIEEIIGNDFSYLIAPQDRELVADRYTRRLRGEKVPADYEFRLMRKDGTILTVDMNVGVFTYLGSIASIGILKDITQRKRVEEALHASEEKFSKAFYSSPQSISITTLNDGRIIEMNDSITKSLGYSREEAIGHTTVELGIWITPEDRIRFVDSFKKKGYVRNMELDLRAKNGNILSMLLSGELIEITGKACMLSTFFNITEHKRAEKEKEVAIINAQNEKNKSEAIIAALGDGIIIQDTNYIITYQNKLQTEIYGEHAGEHCYKVYENRDSICEDCPVEKTFQDGKIHRIERCVQKSGKVLYYELISSPLRDSSGKIIAGVKMVRNITERKHSEEKLRESEQFLESVFESIQDGIGIIDLEMNIIKVNKTAECWYPHAVPLIGKKCYEAYHNRKERCEFCPALETFRTGNSAHEIVPKHGPGGIEVGWLEIYSYPLRDTIGQMKGVIEYVRDITQSRLAEAKRAQLIESEHKALVEVEASRKIDRMKSMFIASTSHELRTPLNSVIGFSSMLLEGYSGQLTPEQKGQIEIVHSSGKHLLTLINDIIDISKIEAGNIKIEVSEFKLGPIVEEAVSMLRVSLYEKNLDLKVNLQDIVMKSDRRRLFQCIVNLISNAIKYTEKGSVEITVKVINNKVNISVADTGIGIKTEDIPKLFVPFVRLQTNLTYKTAGTGLGLYLVKKIAKDFLGGDVEIKSEFGKGSTFTLFVPVDLEGKV